MPTFKEGSISFGITGHAPSGIMNLYLDTPDIDSSLSLSMNPNYSGVMPLKTHGYDIYSSGAPLYIGQDVDDDNDISLYISNDEYAAKGGTVTINNAKLFINGTNLPPYNSGTPIFIKGPLTPPTYSKNTNIPLRIKVEEPVITDDGMILNSGIHTLYIEGNNNALIYDKANNNIKLYLACNPINSENIPLFINRPTSEMLPLNINSFIDSGVMNVYISGNYAHNDSINLSIKPPESNYFEFFLRGYLE